MFKCHECGESFAEPNFVPVSDVSEFWGATVTETRYETHCTACGSDWIDEVQKCQICGQGTEDYLKNFCADCIKEFSDYLTQVKFRMIGEEVKDGDDFEELIGEHFDGGDQYSDEVHIELQHELKQLQTLFKIDYDQLKEITSEVFDW